MALDGSFIRLEIDRRWLQNEEALARRLALIVVGEQSKPFIRFGPEASPCIEQSGFEPYKKGANDSWQLDSGNDWFFFIRDGEGYLHTRYWNMEDLTALDLVLTRLLHGKRGT